MRQIVYIAPEAPPKPPEGASCNGCGVCCLAEPCPLGIVLTRRRQGACELLQWQNDAQVYRCGALAQSDVAVRQVLPRALSWLRPVLVWGLSRWARRWIGAGVGCDCSLTVETIQRPDGI